MHNVLVILIDCLRQDRFEGPGKSALTPNLDRFKERAHYFDNVHTVGSNTTAVMGSWFTGLYPFNNGLRYFSDRKFSQDVPTIASVLGSKGYKTFATATDSLETGEDVLKGFDDVARLSKKHEPIYNGYGERVRQKITELNQAEEPWMYFVHSAELHHHRQCEKQFQKPKYGKTFYDRGISCIDHYLGPILDAVDTENTMVIIFGDHGDNLLYEPSGDFISFAFNMMRSDASLPGLAQYREWCYEQGMKTHSKKILRHNFLFHHDYHLYRFLTNSPMMISLPGQTAPQRVSAPVSSVDMFSTIMDYLEIPVSTPQDGISLKPMMEDPTQAAPERALYLEVFNEFLGHKMAQEKLPQLSAVVVDEWKLVASPLFEQSKPELYNLEQDPDELTNIYGTPGTESLTASLHQKLNEFVEKMQSVKPLAPAVAEGKLAGAGVGGYH
jgi:arylsulfatase A-like enzyme